MTPEPHANARAWVSLAVLFAVGALNLMDKTIIAYLLEPLKAEFALTDTQLGLVSGAAFAVFFALAGLPMGLLADRVNRRNLLAGCLTAWSALTATAGLVQSFAQLLLVRIGVGVSEAGGAPTALSMISDLFPARSRATAMAVYSLGVPAGAIGAYLIAATVLPEAGWRGTFIAAGLPALLLVPLLLLAVREPARGAAGEAEEAAPPFTETLRFIAGQPALLHLIAGITLTSVAMNGVGMWAMTFFVRLHHVDLGDIGPLLGFAYPVPALIGTFAAGVVADRLARRDERWRAWVPAAGTVSCAPIASALVLVPGWDATLALWAAYGLVSGIWSGPGYGLAMTLVGARMRAVQTAILYLLTNLVGFGLAPMIVGVLSDALAPSLGPDALRYAMLAVGLVNLWACLHFVLAGRRLGRAGLTPVLTPAAAQ